MPKCTSRDHHVPFLIFVFSKWLVNEPVEEKKQELQLIQKLTLGKNKASLRKNMGPLSFILILLLHPSSSIPQCCNASLDILVWMFSVKGAGGSFWGEWRVRSGFNVFSFFFLLFGNRNHLASWLNSELYWDCNLILYNCECRSG